MQKTPGDDLDRLTARWGDRYRLWLERGLWWAERDGDKLAASDAETLELLLTEHAALHRDGPA